MVPVALPETRSVPNVEDALLKFWIVDEPVVTSEVPVAFVKDICPIEPVVELSVAMMPSVERSV